MFSKCFDPTLHATTRGQLFLRGAEFKRGNWFISRSRFSEEFANFGESSNQGAFEISKKNQDSVNHFHCNTLTIYFMMRYLLILYFIIFPCSPNSPDLSQIF